MHSKIRQVKTGGPGPGPPELELRHWHSVTTGSLRPGGLESGDVSKNHSPRAGRLGFTEATVFTVTTVVNVNSATVPTVTVAGPHWHSDGRLAARANPPGAESGWQATTTKLKCHLNCYRRTGAADS